MVFWGKDSDNGFECSTLGSPNPTGNQKLGDNRFSAMNARLHGEFGTITLSVGDDIRTYETNDTIENIYQKKIKEGSKNGGPSDTSIIPNIKTTPYVGTMYMSYRGEKRKDVKSNTTFEAIKNGERTSTTRLDKWYKHGNPYAEMNIGDIVVFGDSDTVDTSKEFVVVRIKEIKQLKKGLSDQEKKKWSKAEGWSKEHYDDKIEPNLTEDGGATQIIYEYLCSTEYNPTKDLNNFREDISYQLGYLPLWRAWANENPNLMRELIEKSAGKTLTDSFIKTICNQARALSDIINYDIIPFLQLKDYTLHSGGAEGSDYYGWDQIGREYGLIDTKHYWVPEELNEKPSTRKPPKWNTLISKEDYIEGKEKVTQAAEDNYNFITKSKYKDPKIKDPLLIRDWTQVKYADAVFAVGTIVQPGEDLFPNQEKEKSSEERRKAARPSVTGGTGYAVGMAINEGKPIYVFDQTKHKWYYYDYNINNFKEYNDIPTLTKHFAGIGTRELTEEGKQAIRDVYEKTLENVIDTTKQIEIEEIKQAWTRETVENDPKTLYIFTDNTDRTSGYTPIDKNSDYLKRYGNFTTKLCYPSGTSAVIRGLNNAFPISTQKTYTPKNPEQGNWQDNDYDSFVKTVNEEFNYIYKALATGKYTKIVLPLGGIIGTEDSISNMSKKPRFKNYIELKLQELRDAIKYNDYLSHIQTSEIPSNIIIKTVSYILNSAKDVLKEKDAKLKKFASQLVTKDNVYDILFRSKEFGEILRRTSASKKPFFETLNKAIDGVINGMEDVYVEEQDIEGMLDNQERQALLNNHKRIIDHVSQGIASASTTYMAEEEIAGVIKEMKKPRNYESENIKQAFDPFFTEEEKRTIINALGKRPLQILSLSRETDGVLFAQEVITELKENYKKELSDPTRFNIIEIWSKHDGIPMEAILRLCQEVKVAPIVSFSITGLGNTVWEPNVLKPEHLIKNIGELIKMGLLNPAAVTIRIDPIVPGVTDENKIKSIIDDCRKLGIKKFVTSLMQSYGSYELSEENKHRRVKSRIDQMLKENNLPPYDWDEYYDIKYTKDGKPYYDYFPNKKWIDYYEKILVSWNEELKKEGAEIQSCHMPMMKGLRPSACLDPDIVEMVTGISLKDPQGNYPTEDDVSKLTGKKTGRGCTCYGWRRNLLTGIAAQVKKFGKSKQQCSSNCAYCYAGGKFEKTPFDYYDNKGNLLLTGPATTSLSSGPFSSDNQFLANHPWLSLDSNFQHYIIEHSETGKLLPFTSPGDLENNIIKILQEKDLFNGKQIKDTEFYARNARSAVRAIFTGKTANGPIKNMQKYIDELLNDC